MDQLRKSQKLMHLLTISPAAKLTAASNGHLTVGSLSQDADTDWRRVWTRDQSPAEALPAVEVVPYGLVTGD